MRRLALLAVIPLLAGCADLERSDKKAAAEPQHPQVVIQGIDGTTMSGELLNGSVTLDSGQGELTLLTDHVHSITLAQDVDKVDSDSIKVAGKMKEDRFYLKNEHGVFTLAKDRLRKIDFVANPATTPTMAASSGATVKATAAGMR
jgi:hypothetical protein